MTTPTPHFGDATSLLAAAALVAAGEDSPAVTVLRGCAAANDPAYNEIAKLARGAADYANEFKSFYVMTGSRVRDGSEEFDELVDEFQRDFMLIDPDQLEYHYPQTIVFDHCRGR